MNLSTPTYSVNAAVLTRLVMLRWVARWWWTVVLPLAALVIASLFDPRFLLVALMALLAIVTMGMALVYYNYLLKPWAVRRLRPQSVEINGTHLIFKHVPATDTTVAGEPEIVDLTSIGHMEYSNRMLIIETGTAVDDFVTIPLDAFGQGNDRLAEQFFQSLVDAVVAARADNATY